MAVQRRWTWIVLFFSLGVSLPGFAAAKAQPHTFVAGHGEFLLDGKPFQIISGSMHYARIPRAYWRDRLRMAKAMGLNSITTYVFWNWHEPERGVYDFSGNRDVAEFVREAQQEGLYVILRPGPYSCAEWDFGGFPAWLLKDPNMVVRSRDPQFLAAAQAWLMQLGKQLAPLQIGNGGPIIAVQVENEYGSYGKDHAYMEDIHQMLVDAGFTKAQLYTADGADEIPNGSLPELPAVINFGPGNAQKDFAKLKQLRPDGPMMTGEYWDGWFDHWGAPHTADTPDQQAKDLDWMLRQGYSVSLYMFHGGTSFGWMNGANSDGKTYEPDVTSYDYNSPLDESGHPTPKYYRFRDIIAKDTGIKPPPVPAAPATMTLPAISLDEGVSLWKSLPAAIHSERPLSMEAFGQAYGYILYRTQLDGPVDSRIDLRYGARLCADLCGRKIGGDAGSSAGTTSVAAACFFRPCAAGCSGGKYGASEFWSVAARGTGWACGTSQAGAKSADRVGCLSTADVEAGAIGLLQSALQRSVFLPGQLHGDHAEGYVSGYQRADEGRSVAERPRPGTFLERWPAEDALHPRAVVEAG